MCLAPSFGVLDAICWLLCGGCWLTGCLMMECSMLGVGLSGAGRKWRWDTLAIVDVKQFQAIGEGGECLTLAGLATVIHPCVLLAVANGVAE
jgi:hypothetical protein